MRGCAGARVCGGAGARPDNDTPVARRAREGLSAQRHCRRRPAGGIPVGAPEHVAPDHQRAALEADVEPIEIAPPPSAVVRAVGAETCLVLRAVHATLGGTPL